MDFAISDEVLAIFVPIIAYWVYSGIYMAFDSFDNYKYHAKEDEDEKNLVSKSTVLKGVLLTQSIQVLASGAFLMVTKEDDVADSPKPESSLIDIARQLFVATCVIDTWIYFTHRFLHQNKFLYKHLHSRHHRIIVNYAFGSQYTHPLEGLFVDTMGGVVAFLISGMSPRTSIYFFSFVSIKIVDDHCGMRLPGNLFQIVFRNNCAYHDVHHQLYGGKYNFATFFEVWDKLLGTYMPYSVEKRAEGGFEVRPVREFKKD